MSSPERQFQIVSQNIFDGDVELKVAEAEGRIELCRADNGEPWPVPADVLEAVLKLEAMRQSEDKIWFFDQSIQLNRGEYRTQQGYALIRANHVEWVDRFFIVSEMRIYTADFVRRYDPAPVVDRDDIEDHVRRQTKERKVGGLLIVVAGPGRGRFRPVFEGSNSIGKIESQCIPLSFGDETISGERQAFLVFDPAKQTFTFVPNLDKPNLCHVDQAPVLEPRDLKDGSIIDIGRTSLMLQPLQGAGFNWAEAKALATRIADEYAAGPAAG